MARFLFAPKLGLGVRITIRHVARATDYFLKHISSLPPGGYISVRYEDLCREPGLFVAKVVDWLRLEPKANVDYESFIDSRQSPLLGEVERKRASIFKRMKPYFVYFEYGLNGNGTEGLDLE
jgi:hypothetical protein